ncbi:hypothetical protein D6C92_05000 [Aureobasidium pullulans]|nr:hypothetical protein D6C92_05000 [Aureobasidium pullulans]
MAIGTRGRPAGYDQPTQSSVSKQKVKKGQSSQDDDSESPPKKPPTKAPKKPPTKVPTKAPAKAPAKPPSKAAQSTAEDVGDPDESGKPKKAARKSRKKKNDKKSSGDSDGSKPSDESDAQEKEKSKKKKKRKPKKTSGQQDTPSDSDDEDGNSPDLERRRNKPLVAADVVKLAAFNTAWRLYLEEHYVHKDEQLRYTRRIFDLLENSSLRHLPPELAGAEQAQRHWEALLLPANRALNTFNKSRATRRTNQKVWNLELTLDPNRTKMLDQESNVVAMLSYDVIPSTNADLARKVAEEFRGLMNRWHLPWRVAGGGAIRSLLLEAAYRNVTGTTIAFCRGPNVGSDVIQLPARSLNEEGEILEHSFSMWHSKIPEDVDLASIPDPMPGVKWGTSATHSDVPGAVKPKKLSKGWTVKKWAAARKFMLFFASATHGLLLSGKQMDQLWNFHQENVFGSKKSTRGTPGHLYGRRRLLCAYLRPDHRDYRVVPSDSVLTDLGFQKSDVSSFFMSVKSTLALRVVLALDIGYKTYSLKADPRYTILAVAEAIDMINQEIAEGVPPTAGCVCTKAQCKFEFHPCAVCLDPALCSTLTYNSDGVRVCPGCIGTTKDVDKFAKAIIRERLRWLVRHEAMQSGRDHKNEAHERLKTKCIDELCATLPNQSNGPAYCDAFADNEVVMIPEEMATTGRRMHPDSISIDAKLLRVHAKGIGLMGHAPGNVHITRASINRAKFVWPPGVLALLTRWIKDAEGRQAYAHEFMHQMADMHLLTCKTPFYAAIKNTEKVERSKLQRQRAEIVAGRPTPNEHGPWEQKSQQWIEAKVHPVTVGDEDSFTWEKEPRNGLLNIAAQYEQDLGVKLQYSSDGCPNIGYDTSTKDNPNGLMEEGLNWNSMAVFCRERRERMRLKCNRRHATEDSVYALHAEMIRSACLDYACAKGDCKEPDLHFFHLPKALKIKHPLRLSIGHKHHGLQMLTGWPEEPSDINQRNDKINNIRIETWLENWTKLDLDEDFYDLTREVFTRLVVPRDLYDPTTSPPQDVDVSLAEGQDVNYNAETVAGPSAMDLYEEDVGHGNDPEDPELPLSGKPPSDPKHPSMRSITFEVGQTDYALLTDDDLVGEDHIFYGRTLLVGDQTGYAFTDGTFRTSTGKVVGKHDHDGDFYALAANIASFPKPYAGPCRLAKMIYHLQIPSIVDSESQFFDIVLINDLDVGFANTSDKFVTIDGNVVGSLDTASGTVTDANGGEVGNIGAFSTEEYEMGDDLLGEYQSLEMVSYNGKEKAAALATSLQTGGDGSSVQQRVQTLLPEDHALYGYALQAFLKNGVDGDPLIAFPHADNVFRNVLNDDVVACIRITGVVDVNGNEIALNDAEKSYEKPEDDEGELPPDNARLQAVAQPFSTARNEIDSLAGRGTALDGVVVRVRDAENRDYSIAYPDKNNRFLTRVIPGIQQPTAARAVASWHAIQGNDVVHIRDNEYNMIAWVERGADGVWELHEGSSEA